ALVVPLIVETGYDRRRARRDLVQEAERVCLLHAVAEVLRDDVILVRHAGSYTGDEPCPDTGHADGLKLDCTRSPVIEITKDRHGARVGRPDGEVRALLAVHCSHMRTQPAVELVVRTFVEQV